MAGQVAALPAPRRGPGRTSKGPRLQGRSGAARGARGAPHTMTTALYLIISGVLIGAGISIIWRDVRKNRRGTFVSERDARLPRIGCRRSRCRDHDRARRRAGACAARFVAAGGRGAVTVAGDRRAAHAVSPSPFVTSCGKAAAALQRVAALCDRPRVGGGCQRHSPRLRLTLTLSSRKSGEQRTGSAPSSPAQVVRAASPMPVSRARARASCSSSNGRPCSRRLPPASSGPTPCLPRCACPSALSGSRPGATRTGATAPTAASSWPGKAWPGSGSSSSATASCVPASRRTGRIGPPINASADVPAVGLDGDRAAALLSAMPAAGGGSTRQARSATATRRRASRHGRASMASLRPR